MPSTTTKRAIGYVRVSGDEQYLSPEDQAERIEAWCTAYDHELVEVIAETVSGGVPLAERPEGRRVAEMIAVRRGRRRVPDVDALVVTRLDRLTRDAADGLALIEQFSPNPGLRHPPPSLVALDEHLDLTTAFGRFAAKLRFQFAEFERELIGERTSSVLQRKRANRQPHSREPYGWDRDGDRLVPNGDEQRTIKLMLRWRRAGCNDNVIATRLNERAVPTKRNGRWQANTVHRILLRAGADFRSNLTHDPTRRRGALNQATDLDELPSDRKSAATEPSIPLAHNRPT